MNLADFAKPLAAKNHFVKASFGGFAGSGKSRTGSDFIIGAYKDLGCSKPILFIDNEKGSRFLVPKFEQAGIKCLAKDTTHVADVLQAIEYLNDGEIDFLFVDSLTKVWYQYLRDYRQKNRISFMTLEHWGKILPAWQEEFSDKFVGCNGNFVFTGRGGFQYEKEEDETDERTGKVKKGGFVKSGVKMKMAGETPFEPDLNIWMEQEQEVGPGGIEVFRTAQIMKDRSDQIDGKVFKNPTYEDFRPIVRYIIGTAIGTVEGASNTANLAPSDDFGWYQRKEAREIEVEKIKAIFEKFGLGTSKEDKQLKVLMLETCFSTASGTEIEKMNAERLKLGREKLQRLIVVLADVDPAHRAEKIFAGVDLESEEEKALLAEDVPQ